MQEFGTVIDIGRSVPLFNAIGVKDLPLIRTAKGHLAHNLLDYDNDHLEDFNSFNAIQHGPEGSEEEEVRQAEPSEDGLEEHLRTFHAENDVPDSWNPDDWRDHLDGC